MTFSEWIDTECANRGWSRNELSRRAGLSSGILSMIASGSRKPGPDLCTAIAKALRVPEEEVFRRAGLIDALPQDLPGQDEMAYIYAHLPSDRQAQLREYARFLLDQDEKKEQGFLKKPRTAEG